MTELDPRLVTELDVLFPVPRAAGSWEDVLARAQTPFVRRPLVLAVAGVVMLLGSAAAVTAALGGRSRRAAEKPRFSPRTAQPISGRGIRTSACAGPRGGRAGPARPSETDTCAPPGPIPESPSTRFPVFGSFSTKRYALPPTMARCVPSIASTFTRETPSAAIPNDTSALG